MSGVKDQIANLQLLPGGENIGTGGRHPMSWAEERYPDSDQLMGYLSQNDMTDLPEGLDGFLGFYEARRERLKERLLRV